MSDATAKITLELPLEMFSALRRSPEEFGRDIRLAAAIHWYSTGELSMEKAAMIAGLNRRDFLHELATRKIDSFKDSREDAGSPPDTGPSVSRWRRRRGAGPRGVRLSEDFDEPLPDFADY